MVFFSGGSCFSQQQKQIQSADDLVRRRGGGCIYRWMLCGCIHHYWGCVISELITVTNNFPMQLYVCVCGIEWYLILWKKSLFKINIGNYFAIYVDDNALSISVRGFFIVQKSPLRLYVNNCIISCVYCIQLYILTFL